ncbi:MAG: hypothetical protein MUC34_07715 [Anaerolineae bacterium]|jgi:hypothetical protein|nr:hypothetical protein [Anaerolineae bacterium]
MKGRTTWAKGLSERVGQRAPRAARTLLRMIQKVGEEKILYPPEGEGGVLMTRREALARVLWTRALRDGDLGCAKLLIECMDAQSGTGKAPPKDAAAQPGMRHSDLLAAEKLLAEWRDRKLGGPA